MKFALVTGGSRGIGRAVCVKLAGMGYHIIINYKSNEAEAIQTLALVRERGADGELLQFDVSDRGDIKQKLGDWIEKNPDKTIEVLINNAGIREDALLVFMKDEQWDNVLKINPDGFFFVTRLLIGDMLVKKFGRIINIVSLSGLKGLPGQTNYSAAKAGVIGATKALAQEVGRKGVTVNAVAPGFIKTDMTEGLDEKELKNMIPVKRFGTPEEVAHAVGFLVAPEAGYITGEVISVNGGLYS
ncbi:MAG: 3-oxoacyl-ACP reductase FabG [Chitinophagaceae bacterium]|nr:3-oxoacyl-ACP reductase FabG [Chitinophagaceae bacterium]